METGLRRTPHTLARQQRGGMLLEVVIALLVFAAMGATLLGSASVVSLTSRKVEVQAAGEALARNQMEHVFSLPYQDPPSSYPTVTPPPDFTVTAEAEVYVPGNPNIQRVVVEAQYVDGSTYVLETLRTR